MQRYRDIAGTLAGPREAGALIETLDRLTKNFRSSARAAGSIRSRQARSPAAAYRMTAPILRPPIDAAIAACGEGLCGSSSFSLPDQPRTAADVLAEGARKTMRRASEGLEKAATRGEAEDFHDLRKAVKAHWMHLSLLARSGRADQARARRSRR